MKTILVPTDFSNNAYKALEYASFLACQIGAKVLVLNAYQIPSGTSNVMINFADILEKDAIADLGRLIDKIKKVEDFKGVEFESVSCYGYLTEAIKITAKHHQIDLIVMGTAGASNVSSKIFGSNTLATIRKAEFSIVVVPHEAEFSLWKNILLASNQDDSVITAVKKLNELINLHDVTMDILAVEPNNGLNAPDHSNLRKNLNGWQYALHTERNDNVVEGILKYADSHPSDIIILLRKSYNFLERILHSSVTKKMALHSNKPLFLFKG